MRRHLTPILTTAICCLGLQACFLGPESPSDPEGKLTTISLHRLENGDLEYCDDNGECQQVPYDGQCETVEIDIDTATGQTCERCIMEDGEVVDNGCGNVSVGCVVVTLPEPDCVVCAYVNGAVLFSSCVVNEPECQSDADCWGPDGRSGSCIDGQCVYGPGCRDDAECPPGFICMFDGSTNLGFCEPRDPEAECRSDADCPDGLRCEEICECWANDPDGTTDSDRPEHCECKGFCVPDEPPPPECLSDADCPDGMRCEEICECAAGTDPNGDQASPEYCECFGICVRDEPPPPECLSDADCPDGLICELQTACPPCTDDGSQACDQPCQVFGICVPPQQGECQSDADCPDDMMCVMACWDCAPDSNDCFGGCEGYCVPREPRPECRSDADCPNGYCEAAYACDAIGCIEPEGGFCVFPNCDDGTEPLCDMIPPVCAPGEVLAVRDHCWACLDARSCGQNQNGCTSDAECGPGEACEQICTCAEPTDPQDPATGGVAPCECFGVCVPVEPPPRECLDDADCPDGLVCQLETYCPPCDDTTGEPCPGMPCYQGGICVEPRPDECQSDADCPDDMMCLVACWDCRPDDPNCAGGCFGTCEPRDPTLECRADEDCRTADGRQGRCLNGACEF